MSIEAQREICAALLENQDAALRALANNDRVALAALARDEARLMDMLSACWSVDR